MINNFLASSKRTKTFFIFLLCTGLFFSSSALAAPPTSKYSFGETLAPTCAPGATNCTVNSPQESNAYLTDIAGITSNQGDLLYFNGTDWVDLSPGTSGQYLQTQGSSANPTWADVSGTSTTTLTSAYLFVGNSSNVATGVALSGDASLSNTGALTISANSVALGTDTTGNYVESVSSGTGLSGGSAGSEGSALTLNLDIDGLTSESSVSDSDAIAIYDASATGIRKMTRANFLSGVTGALVYQGGWNASSNSPALADGTGTQGNYYVVTTGGSVDLGAGSITFTVGDWVIHNGTEWEKLDSTNDVQSVAGKTGIVTLDSGDVGLGNVENTALSSWAGTTNITTLGTITTGTWNGTVIDQAYLNGQSGTNTGDETVASVGTLINGATTKATPVDADQIGLMDSAASNILKKLSWANIKATLKTYFDTLYQTALTFGISDDNAVAIDSASVADDEYARFTANGLESRSTTELLSDINPMTTAGDIIYGGTLGVQTRLPKGTANQVLTMNSGATAPEWDTPASSEYSDGGEAGGADRTLGNTDNFDLGFITNNTNRLHIQNDGNVGIGTTAPEGNLHVMDSVVSGSNTHADDTFIIERNGDNVINIISSSTNSGAVAFSDDERAQGYVLYDHLGDNMQFATNGVEKIRILSNGNVGIGTTAPTTKLEVNGYTKLGSDAPAIKMKKISGTTPSTVSATGSYSHGLTKAKILGVQIVVENTVGVLMIPNHLETSDSEFYSVYVTDVALTVTTGSNAVNILDKPFRAIITYEE